MYNRYIKDKNVKGKQNGIEMELINKRQVSFNIKSINLKILSYLKIYFCMYTNIKMVKHGTYVLWTGKIINNNFCDLKLIRT